MHLLHLAWLKDYSLCFSVHSCTDEGIGWQSITAKTVVLVRATPLTLLQIQSAFMIDLAQVSLAIRNCTARSLIVIDEFGKGTIPSGRVYLPFIPRFHFSWILEFCQMVQDFSVVSCDTCFLEAMTARWFLWQRTFTTFSRTASFPPTSLSSSLTCKSLSRTKLDI